MWSITESDIESIAIGGGILGTGGGGNLQAVPEFFGVGPQASACGGGTAGVFFGGGIIFGTCRRFPVFFFTGGSPRSAREPLGNPIAGGRPSAAASGLPRSILPHCHSY